MNELLTPPPVRELPGHRAAEMRAELLRLATREQRHRVSRGRVAAGLAAVAVAMALLLLLQPFRPDAVPAPATSPSPASTAGPGDGVIQDDLGVLGRDRTADLLDECRRQRNLPSTPSGSVDLALTSATMGPTLWLTTSHQVFICGPSTGQLAVADGLPPKPTRNDPVRVAIHTADTVGTGGSRDTTFRAEALLAVETDDTVDHLLLRVRCQGRTSPWYRAEVHDRYAVVGAAMEVQGDPNAGDITSDARAVTSDGREIEIG